MHLKDFKSVETPGTLAWRVLPDIWTLESDVSADNHFIIEQFVAKLGTGDFNVCDEAVDSDAHCFSS